MKKHLLFNAARILLVCSMGASSIFAAPSTVTVDSVNNLFVPETYGMPQTYAGYLGHRMQINEGQLFKGELSGPNDFFAPFKTPTECPGCCGWEGAWAGRFFDACCYSYQYTHDPRMRARIDSMATTLKTVQGSDGYMGTYSPTCRWTPQLSDVWVHSYDLICLLHYYQLTADAATLQACVKIGDLLCATFGPGKKDIVCQAWQGMSATSILLPMGSLYRYTGNQKYRDFCDYVTTAIEQPDGSKIISDMLAGKDIALDAPKAYEKLCNLLGILDYYRITRNPQYLTVCLNAWNNIHPHHHFVSGTSAGDEDFTAPDVYKPTRAVETCVDVSWLQFTHSLFELTGDPKYADEIEQDVYNALLTSQHPVSGYYCYFTALNGRRDPNDPTYGWKRSFADTHICCQGSLWRGLGMIPFLAAGALNNDPAIILYLSGDHTLNLNGTQTQVQLHIDTRYPETGDIAIAVNLSAGATFTLQLYVPSWCKGYSASVNGQSYAGTAGAFLGINRLWANHDTVKITMPLRSFQVWDGNSTAPRQYAIQRGPQLLSKDDTITTTTLPQAWGGSQVYDIAFRQDVQTLHRIMVPYAEAGQLGISNFQTVGDSVYLLANDSATRSSVAKSAPIDGGVHWRVSDHSMIVRIETARLGRVNRIAVFSMDGKECYAASADAKAAPQNEFRIPLSIPGLYVVRVQCDRAQIRQVVSYCGGVSP